MSKPDKKVEIVNTCDNSPWRKVFEFIKRNAPCGQFDHFEEPPNTLMFRLESDNVHFQRIYYIKLIAMTKEKFVGVVRSSDNITGTFNVMNFIGSTVVEKAERNTVELIIQSKDEWFEEKTNFISIYVEDCRFGLFFGCTTTLGHEEYTEYYRITDIN